MSALFCYWRAEEGQRRLGEGGEAVVRLCVEGGRVGLLIPALCLPWQGGGPTPVRSLLEQTGALFPLPVGWELDVARRQTWGAAATPVSEWAQCGSVPPWLDLAVETFCSQTLVRIMKWLQFRWCI